MVPRPERSYSSTPPIVERKREITRRALAEAALELAAERGFDNVTVPDIAAVVGVSARTFNNYFAGKEEAVVAPGFDRAVRILTAFEQRPVSESLWEAISFAILTQFPDEIETDSAAVDSARMVKSDRVLRGEQLRAGAAIEEKLAAAITNRVESSASYGITPHIIAAAAVTATRIAFDHWIDAESGSSLRAAIAEALVLAGGDFGAIGMRTEQ